MRIGKRGFGARIKGVLRIEFGRERLTSFAGLELIRRFLRRVGFHAALGELEKRAAVGGDFSPRRTILTVVAMLLVGGKRLHHLSFLREDPMVLRFAGLSRAPTERSLGRALARFSFRTWPELDRLAVLVARAALDEVDSRRWTIDIDGSVITTGQRVERAEHGYNPGHRKNPSYYPIVATLAQTSHIIGHQNRSGNVNDSHRSDVFLRNTVRRARNELGLEGVIEVRADSAFFKRNFLRTADRLGLEYTIKVGMWPWLNIRQIVKAKSEREWKWIDRKVGLQGTFATLSIAQWGRVERIAIFRKRVTRKPVKAWQLDLFHPDDGYWEYSVVATNKTLGLRALWAFQAGRGVQEKTIGELKSGYAFAAVPTLNYRANTAWQKLNVLAHNTAVSFQIVTTPTDRPKTPKRTAIFRLQTIATLRFEWLSKAARLIRPRGASVLRLADNV
ncbi:MAG TPA: IS1380 family transposase, partial [Polyangiaceae bacterium]|nr:IS1380 family transposase [Polyangiaceae bacterium]